MTALIASRLGTGTGGARLDPEAQAALQSPRALAFLRWSRFPFIQVERHTSPPTIWLNDYRYANVGAYGWSATRIQ